MTVPNMVSMKISKAEREKRYKSLETSAVVDAPIYPWGLSLNLDEEALEKLGIDTLPEVGKPLLLMARVDVTSVSENKHTSEGGESRESRSVGLQITDLCLEPEPDKGSVADRLYGKG